MRSRTTALAVRRRRRGSGSEQLARAYTPAMSTRHLGAIVCVVLVACAATGPTAPPKATPPLAGVDAVEAGTSGRSACTAASLPAPEASADPENSMPAPEPDVDSVSAREEPWSEDAKVAACEVTIKTVGSATAAVLALPAPAKGGAAAAFAPWDHKKVPVGLDRVKKRFALTDAELAQLSRDGVVVPSRIAAGDWAESLHEVWQSELPLWVSADAVFHAVYASNDRLVARIEETSLAPRAVNAITAMHCGLLEAGASGPREVLHDVDLYLTVARSLLASAPVASMTGGGVDAEAKDLVARLEKAEGLSAFEV